MPPTIFSLARSGGFLNGAEHFVLSTLREMGNTKLKLSTLSRIFMLCDSFIHLHSQSSASSRKGVLYTRGISKGPWQVWCDELAYAVEGWRDVKDS